jgi:hypothetical protein
MCWFIRATLPKAVGAETLHRLLPLGPRFRPLEDPRVEPGLQPDEAYYSVNYSYCACDSLIGSAHRYTAPSKSVDLEGQAQQLGRKGWSASRVQRWLEQKQESTARRGLRTTREAMKEEQEAADWLAFLRSALLQHHLPYVGILLTWEGRGHPKPSVERTESVSIAHCDAARLAAFEPNVLYRVVPDRRQGATAGGRLTD